MSNLRLSAHLEADDGRTVPEGTPPAAFAPPDRPFSAPPNLDDQYFAALHQHSSSLGFGLGAHGPVEKKLSVYQPWTEPPDRPRSAPPGEPPPGLEGQLVGGFGEDSLGALASSTSGSRLRSHLGAIGSARTQASPSWGGILDPRGKGLFAFQPELNQLNNRMPLSPTPPLKEEGEDGSGEDGEDEHPCEATPDLMPLSTEGLSTSEADRKALYIELQAARAAALSRGGGSGAVEAGSLADLPGSRRSTPPPASLHSALQGSPGPHSQAHTPPPGFGSPCGMHTGIGGDEGPQLLHPGAVRAFDPIDRPSSAPAAMDIPNASLLAFQASFGGGIQTPDIRCDESYNDFYHLYADQNYNLPPPLDPSHDLARGLDGKDRTPDGALETHASATSMGMSPPPFPPTPGLPDRHGLAAQPPPTTQQAPMCPGHHRHHGMALAV